MKAKSARGEETRLRMIRTAQDLFHKQGVRATSPDQIIEASRTGKGQFYHYFRSKEGLVHEVLQAQLDAIKTGATPLQYTIRSWEDLERWFIGHIEQQKSFDMSRGCPFGTIANELNEADELLRLDLTLIFEMIRHNVVVFFGGEKSAGRLCCYADPEQMGDFCVAAIQGAMMMGKVKRDSKPAEGVVREALAHLKRYAIESEIGPSS
jgi:AcrR family transcriptional regulator